MRGVRQRIILQEPPDPLHQAAADRLMKLQADTPYTSVRRCPSCALTKVMNHHLPLGSQHHVQQETAAFFDQLAMEVGPQFCAQPQFFDAGHKLLQRTEYA